MSELIKKIDLLTKYNILRMIVCEYKVFITKILNNL